MVEMNVKGDIYATDRKLKIFFIMTVEAISINGINIRVRGKKKPRIAREDLQN